VAPELLQEPESLVEICELKSLSGVCAALAAPTSDANWRDRSHEIDTSMLLDGAEEAVLTSVDKREHAVPACGPAD
jgi:hypothetical protein